MWSETELEVIRRAYARQITFAAGVEDRAVDAAFAAVRREAFFGAGPWPLLYWDEYRRTPSADPVYLYSDVLIGIIPERHLNNGQPSAHAMWIASAAPKQGEHVVHVGAGVGYYSAIMAHMVGPNGRVTAIEYDPALSARAAANLSELPHVQVIQGDGASVSFDSADVIYVNAGVTRPAESWLDGLQDGGRLILPLTTDENFKTPREETISQGAMFFIRRTGAGFDAKAVSPIGVIPCESMRDAESESALAEAFGNKGWRRVTKLYRTDTIPADRCWLGGQGWCLAYS
jgi:protein-L-isoaspartate(D-aspartate) O-methyltransferase